MPDSNLEFIERTWGEVAQRRFPFGEATDKCTDVEAVLLLACEVRTLLHDGGFMMFLQNGYALEQAAQTFDVLRLAAVGAVFRRVRDLFPAWHVSPNYEQRMAMVDQLYDEQLATMQELEADFFKQEALIQAALVRWIREHRLGGGDAHSED